MRHLLAKMTWEDVNEAVKARRVVLVPVGAIEQHGPHLPVDTDNLSVETVCLRAAKRDRIVPGIRARTTYFWEDLMGASPVKFTDWRRTQTETGIGGDPTLATAEKGARIVGAAAARIIEVAREFRDLDFGPRRSFLVSAPEE